MRSRIDERLFSRCDSARKERSREPISLQREMKRR
jgi:hypothetical protein